MDTGIATALGLVFTLATGVCLGMLVAWFIRGICREVWSGIQALDKRSKEG